MTGRNARGQFTPGNGFASIGGRARAAQLPPEQRRAIAQAGFRALAARRFEGRTRRCAAWLFDPLGYRSEV
jgi:hypothetical protein